MIQSSGHHARTVTLVILDASVILLAYVAAYFARFHTGIFGPTLPELQIQPYLEHALLFVPVWLIAIAAEGGYNRRYQLVGGEEYRRIFHAATFSVFVTTLVLFVMKIDISRGWAIAAWVFAVALLLIGRFAYRHIQHGRNRRTLGRSRVLIVGANHEAAELAHTIDGAAHLGARVVGHLDGSGDIDPSVSPVGSVDDLGRMVIEKRIDAVVIVPSALGPMAQEAYKAVKAVNCSVFIAPSLREVLASRVSVQPVADVPLIRIEPVSIVGLPRVVKRGFDLLGGLAILVILTPLFLILSIAIRMDSPGPAIFTQKRVGRSTRLFDIYKFRSMHVDAEARLAELEGHNEADGHIFKMKDDPRITRMGKYLRRWSLDELPQLFNVIKGEMSLVGPRPPLPAEVEKYDEWQMNRLGTVPGMTGYWQVSGRSEVSFTDMVKMDIFYIENWSVTFDLYILARTLGAVLSKRGAY